MANGKFGMGNGNRKCQMRNRDWGMGNGICGNGMGKGKRGMGNLKWEFFLY